MRRAAVAAFESPRRKRENKVPNASVTDRWSNNNRGVLTQMNITRLRNVVLANGLADAAATGRQDSDQDQAACDVEFERTLSRCVETGEPTRLVVAHVGFVQVVVAASAFRFCLRIVR